MNFSIAETILRLLAPQHKLSCSWWVWNRLVSSLRERGHERSRESGAFLLGHRQNGVARIRTFVLYDDLDPGCLDTGIIRFDGRYFGGLWDLCKRRNLSVVADVHTHPADCEQSESDQSNPMISRAGHVALILPDFGAPPLRRIDIGIYLYEGAKQWRRVPPASRSAYFQIGL